jgi:hypothetical protein
LVNNGFDADNATKNVKGTTSRSLCAREAILNKAFLKLLSYGFEVPVSLRNNELLGRSSRVQPQPSKTAVNVERGGRLFFISRMCIWDTTGAGKREAIRTMPTPSPHSFLVRPVS